MKVNFNVPVKDYKGEGITKSVAYTAEDGKTKTKEVPVIIKDLLAEQLYFGRGLESVSDQEKDDTNKFIAVKLSDRIYRALGEINISTEEAVIIKKVARQCFTAGVFVQVCKLIGEGGEDVCE